MKIKLFLIGFILVLITGKVMAAATITTTGSFLTAPTITYGTVGSNITFTVAGTGLSAGITVTAPSGYEVSTSSGSGFASFIVVGSAPTVGTTTVYVRLTVTSTVGYHGFTNIVCSSTGATTMNVSIQGSVNAATLTITANVPSKVYGTTLSSGSGSTNFTTTGLKNSETVGTVSMNYYTGAAATQAVGTYTTQAQPSGATGGTFSAGNYSISYVSGSITVTAAPLTITANGFSKAYGSTITGASGSTAFTSSGLQNGETVGTVTIAYGTGSAGSAAIGIYAGSVTPSAATGGTFAATNYSITYVSGSLTVGPATLTITGAASKVYGATLTNGTGSTNFTASGLQNSETIGTVTVAYGTGAAATADVGTYTGTVTPSAATGGTFTAANYIIVYTAGNLTVTAKALTVTSVAATNKVYTGTNAATITGTLSGIINSDVVTLVGTGTFASVNVATGIAVTSTSTLGGADAGNYTLTQPTGLTANITKAALTITATGPQYDNTQSIAVITGSTTYFTYSGTVNGETISSVTLTPNKSGVQTAGTAYLVVPSAPAGPGAFLSSNYTITPVNFSGTVGYQYTWTGSSSVNWNVSGNWSGGGGSFPKVNDNVIIPNTTTKPKVNVASACGSMSVTGTTTLTLSAALTSSGLLTIGGNTFTFTVSGTNTATFGGLTDIGYQSTFVISAGATVTFNSNSIVTNSSSQGAITNGGTLNFSANSTLNLGYACTLVNNGTVSATSTIFNFSGSSITNNKTFKATSSTFNIAGSGDFFLNTGSGTTMTTKTCTFLTTGTSDYFSNASNATYLDHGSTFNLSAGYQAYINNAGTMTLHGTSITAASSGAQYITNSNMLQIDSGATIALSTGSSYITNSGIFNAGISNSPVSITLSGAPSGITNTATFNLGSTSIITVSGSSAYVTNNSPGVFTLESDAYGSASFGQSASNATIGGSAIYNVQRYMKGGNSLTYRGYRLVSSPVNLTSTSGGGNVNLQYLNTNNTVVNPNGVVGTTTYKGALTGGPSGTINGFTTAGAFGNPTIYMYDESQTSNTSTSFTSGKTPGVAAVTSSGISIKYGSTTPVTKTIPVGNGYMMYFIGDNASATNYTTAHIPEDTYITATGNINQQTVPVTIWWSGSTNLSDATTGASGGFNLVGNPYASTIDLNKVTADNGYTILKYAELSDVTGQFVYWSITTSGSTITSSFGSDVSYSSQYVASGQGFMVLAPGTSQTLNFKEDQKVYNPLLLNNVGTSPTPGLMTAPSRQLQLASNMATPLNSLNTGITTYALAAAPASNFGLLQLVFRKDSVTSDGVAIAFGKDWTDKYEDEADAMDLDGNSKIYLSSYTSNNVRVAVNRMGNYTNGKRVKLYVKASTDGLYTITLPAISGIDTSLYNVFLVDNLKKDSLDMVRYGTYNFNYTIADTASYHTRFEVAVERKPLPAYALLSFTGQKITNGVQLNWKTSNEGNYTGFALQKQDAVGQFNMLYSKQSDGSARYTFTDNSPNKNSNVYRLQQNDIDGNITYSSNIVIIYDPATTGSGSLLSVYPNPSKSLITINVDPGQQTTTLGYVASIYNNVGALVCNKAVSSTSWNEDISSYKPGIYIIELRTVGGGFVGKSKFIKTN